MDKDKDKTVIDKELAAEPIQVEQEDADRRVEESNKRMAAYAKALAPKED